MKIKAEVAAFKRRLIIAALRETNGNVRAAARMLGTHSTNVERWMRELNLLDFAYRLRRTPAILDPFVGPLPPPFTDAARK